MRRIYLSIKSSYVPSWGLWDGIRELIQNGLDAERELGAKLEVEWVPSTKYGKGEDGKGFGIVRVTNEGATMPREALLMGHTTKADRSDLRGQFGEGLKLGCLALVRQGMDVTIRNGSEVWTPIVARSDQYQADVLAFDVERGRKGLDRVCVEMGPVCRETWEVLRRRFLFLVSAQNTVETNHGSLLLDPEQKGQVYVKGIYVSTDSRLEVGYNFAEATLDRDRRMVEGWNLGWLTKQVWISATNKDPKLLPRLMGMAETSAQDVGTIGESDAGYLNEERRTEAAKAFLKTYGEDAVPVSTMAESQRLEHLGKKGVVVSKQTAAVLQSVLGTPAQVTQRLLNEVVKTWSWHDLSEAERAALSWAVAMVGHAAKVVGLDEQLATLEQVGVVDFRDERLLGQFSPKTSKTLVARKMLANQVGCLRVVLHEVAHSVASDADHDHIATVEKLWVAVVQQILEAQ